MKISHILSHVASEHAGVPIATRKMAQAILRLGVDVSFWTTGDGADNMEVLQEGIPSQIYPRAWPYGWRYSPQFAGALGRAAGKIDLLHIHEVWSYPQLAAAWVGARTRTPYLWAPRASLEPWRMKYKGWKKKAYFSLCGSQMMKHAACMHAVAPREVEGFRLLGYRGPVAVVPNGVSAEEFRVLPDPALAEAAWPQLVGRRVVLSLSRLSREKGLDQLLPAWAALVQRETHSDGLLVLAGPDDRGYHQVMVDMIASLGLQNHVLLTGMVQGEQKLALIARADIYVLPSYSEGFSNSLLENLAAGKPSLITPGCNFPEAVAAGAAVCVDPACGPIAEALQLLLDLPDGELHAMGQKGRELVLNNYTWEVAARRLVTVYRAILGGGVIPEFPEPVAVDAAGRAVA